MDGRIAFCREKYTGSIDGFYSDHKWLVLSELIKMAYEEGTGVEWIIGEHGVLKGLLIRSIPSMVTQLGSYYDLECVRACLRGMQHKSEQVHALTTHDLNSARIGSVSELISDLCWN